MAGSMEADSRGDGIPDGIPHGTDGRPMAGAMEGHADRRSMCLRTFEAGPVSTVTILPAVYSRSMAARKALAVTPLASGSVAISDGALPRPVLGRTGRP